VELHAASFTLQPGKWKSGSTEFASNERLAELVFDRLVTLDNYGRFQPGLATQWSHDKASKRWQFTLRQDVKFSDGTALTPGDVVAAMQPLLPRGMQVTPTAAGVSIQCASATNDLLELLASGPYFIYKDNGNGLLRGTGPFALESVSASVREGDRVSGDGVAAPTQRLRFRANELCWSGRPYLDAVEVTLGVAQARALLDLQLGKADLGELSMDTAKRAEQSNLKCWASAPLTLYALKFSGETKTENERLLREVINLAVDREAMARVLLQKQAEPSGAFLPQWLSGYAFLFDVESNVEHAKELRAKLPGNAVGVAAALRINVEANNELSRLVAERIAVSARAAGLTLQTVKSTRATGDAAGTKNDGDAQLVAWRYTTLSPRASLENLATALKWQIPEGGVPDEPDARYAWEKRMMDEKNLLPIVAVPDFAALAGQVRNWAPSPWGEWRLADVWLEQSEAGSKSPAGTKP
jgi:ABC-type transport system substrate-binding protein